MSFYDPFIERDRDGIREAIRQFAEANSADEVFAQVARFAVLGYAPSQHGNAALLGCLAAHDLRDELGGAYLAVLAECGVYAAMARPPWSEPPILDPPDVDASAGADEELAEAISSGDRLRAERWLAARIDDPHLASAYFGRAAATFADGGMALIVAAAAWRLADLLGEKGRFATLRTGLWAIAASGDRAYEPRGRMLEATSLLERLTDCAASEAGAVDAIRPLFLLDAALTACEMCGDPAVLLRTRDFLTLTMEQRDGGDPQHAGSVLPDSGLAPYSLGRDYASALIAHAAAARFRERFPNVDVAPIAAAAAANLATGESFEEWT